jgi:phosphatidate cytidylyltransferase
MLKVFFLNTPQEITWIFSGLLVFLSLCSFLFFLLDKHKTSALSKELILRTKTWWKIALLTLLIAILPDIWAVIIISYISFLAFRELITVLPLDSINRTSIALCYAAIPLYYAIIYLKWLSIDPSLLLVALFFMILFFSLRGLYIIAVRRAVILLFFSCFLTLYLPSHLILILQHTYTNPNIEPRLLLLFFIFLVSFNDVFQFTWGKLLGKTRLFPKTSPNKTLEGFILGVLTTLIFGIVLRFLTPFSYSQTLIVSGMIGITGFLGDLTLSAIKRKIGIKDYGLALPGHGGVLDRIDSLLFSAPIFYYLVVYLIFIYE